MLSCSHSWRNLSRCWEPRASGSCLLAWHRELSSVPPRLQLYEGSLESGWLVKPQLSFLFVLRENLFSLDFLLSVLVSLGYSNKWSQTEWSETTGMYAFLVQEAWSSESRCGLFSFWSLWEKNLFHASSLLPGLAGGPQHSLACACPPPVPALSSCGLLPCVPPCLRGLLRRILVTGLRAHPNPGWFYLSSVTSAETLFPAQVTFWYSGWTWILEDPFLPTILSISTSHR